MRIAVAAICLIGCTAPNPDYLPPGGIGGGGGGAMSPGIDAGVVDLATAPDLAPSGCENGDRACSGATATACIGGKTVTERDCPGGPDPSAGLCAAGYCQVPAGAPNCDVGGGPSENFCYQQVSPSSSCQPFLTAKAGVEWACADVVGTKASGDACKSGADCRSGFCATNGTCFRACTAAQDCPQRSPALQCKPVSLLVEGLPVSARSCVP